VSNTYIIFSNITWNFPGNIYMYIRFLDSRVSSIERQNSYTSVLFFHSFSLFPCSFLFSIQKEMCTSVMGSVRST